MVTVTPCILRAEVRNSFMLPGRQVLEGVLSSLNATTNSIRCMLCEGWLRKKSQKYTEKDTLHIHLGKLQVSSRLIIPFLFLNEMTFNRLNSFLFVTKCHFFMCTSLL